MLTVLFFGTFPVPRHFLHGFVIIRPDPPHWRQVETIYHAALEREPEGRSAYLADACGQDQELLREVESLLEQQVSGTGLFARTVKRQSFENQKVVECRPVTVRNGSFLKQIVLLIYRDCFSNLVFKLFNYFFDLYNPASLRC